MAQPDLRRFDQRGILIGAAGVALVAGDDGLLLLDGSAETNADRIERNIDTPYLGAKPGSMKNHRATISGNIELTPPTVPGHATNGVASTKRALLCCGIAQTLTALSRVTRYTPISDSLPLSDALWYHAGQFLDVQDIAGDLSELKMEIGERFSAKVSYEGTYAALAETALPTIDLTEFPEPTVATYDNSTLILNSLGDAAITDLHLRAKKLQASFGNTKGVKEYTEFKKGSITKRDGTFTMLIAVTALGDFNPDAIKRSREYITAEWMTREADGRYSLLGIRGQIDSWKKADIDGDDGFEISGPCVPSSSGNDEIWIEYGDNTFGLNGTLSAGVDTVPYVANGLSASGEYVGALTWTVSTGTLPTGLSIAAGTGIISGTPTGGAGISSFTITATDSTPGTPLTASLATSITITV